jgi:hypothetical protein
MLLENHGIRLELTNEQDIAYHKRLGWIEVKEPELKTPEPEEQTEPLAEQKPKAKGKVTK